jgi:hypothetical protein
MSLVICPGCTRHIKRRESQCPFCGTAVSEDVASTPERTYPSARLGRAALAAFAAATVGAGCGGKSVEQGPAANGGAAGNAGTASNGGTGAAAGAAGKPVGSGGLKSTGGTLGTGGLSNMGGFVSVPPYGIPPYYSGGATSASGGSPATPVDASVPDASLPGFDCIDDFAGGVPARCCPSPPPDCSDKPDGYPGYACVTPPHSFCSCHCRLRVWQCAC